MDGRPRQHVGGFVGVAVVVVVLVVVGAALVVVAAAVAVDERICHSYRLSRRARGGGIVVVRRVYWKIGTEKLEHAVADSMWYATMLRPSLGNQDITELVESQMPERTYVRHGS